VKPSEVPVQTQGRNININLLPQHVPQPIAQLRDPIDLKQLSQGEANVANNPPLQVEKVQ
jgi:hypothetical protein